MVAARGATRTGQEARPTLRRILIARHGERRIAEEHEFHSLKEDAGRIPIIVGFQRRKVFVFEIKANGTGPAIAEPGFFGVRKSANESIRQCQSARLAAGVAADVGDSAVGPTF